MYHKLIFEPTVELPPIADLYDKGISLWGTSKTFGMAGLRIGWLVSQDEEYLKKVSDWLFEDRLSKEFETVGFFISDHPLNQFKDIFKEYGIINYD